jgi:Rad3-related DNA helicase
VLKTFSFMASLLKDILLRHQQWEEEEDVKRNGNGVRVNNSVDACVEGGTAVQILGKASTESALLNGNSTSGTAIPLSTDEKAAAKRKCRYPTRPPGLRWPAVSDNVKHETAPSVSAVTSSAVQSLSSSSAAMGTQPQSFQVQSGSNLSVPPTTLSSGVGSSVASPTPPSAPAAATAATLALPFTLYPVQQEMCATISNVLTSCKPHVVPVAVAEVPTGCGKTMALLSGVLRYQQELKRMTAKEADAFLFARRPPWLHAPPRRQAKKTAVSRKRAANWKKRSDADGACASASTGSNDNADESDSDTATDDGGVDAGWAVPRSFFKHFRVNSQRKIRAELDVTGSQELRRRFLPPPCTIYYVTRTHAQLRQAVRELRRLHGAPGAIRMNILGSRERYCIHPKVVQAKANHTLPVEGNNLGEVCDKLASMGLCEMVDKYDELSCSAIGGSIGHQRGLIWDVEDLVLEGSARSMCPYYAARDLVFFADINFCTYPYLLDPLIRHETKMEAALQNNAIVVFDEAHNVAAVCQDALSLECPRSALSVILSELEPLVANRHTLTHNVATTMQTSSSSAGLASELNRGPAGEGFATLQYPRELHLGSYTLVEIFSFLYTLFRSISSFVDQVAKRPADVSSTGRPVNQRNAKRSREAGDGGSVDQGGDYTQGTELEKYLRRDIEAFMQTLNRSTRGESAGTPAAAAAFLPLFQRAYGVIMSLGVTFNPFLFSNFGLSMLKRWLLLLRFLLQKPRSFVLTAGSPTVTDDAPPYPPVTREVLSSGMERRDGKGSRDQLADAADPLGAASHATIEIRCLDGSLAFNHLLHSVHRVVLASGTLAPFSQLAQDLGIDSLQWRTIEGLHVVPPAQYQLTALTALPLPLSSVSSSLSSGNTTNSTVPLRCTYASLSNPTFLKAVAHCVVRLAQTVQRGGGGGVLFFVPNYAVLHCLATITREVMLMASQARPSQPHVSPIELFLEPRKAEALTQVLQQFQSHTQGPQGGTALFFSVYRGKVSEGIDFTDSMARLVICLGVPLQPLKSWRVIAQRAYSGSSWYTTDAVRAVNQALGRCLRHVRDYGAVVLLDERYAQAEYQHRLSRWCRSTLRTEASLEHLCDALQGAFAQWHHELGPRLTSSATATVIRSGTGDARSSASSDGVAAAVAHTRAFGRGVGGETQCPGSQAHEESEGAGRGRLGTDQLPFQFVRRSPLRRALHERERDSNRAAATGCVAESCHSADMLHTADADATASSKAKDGLLHSPFACTAVKLLYEAVHSTSEVSRQDLHAAIELLADVFKEEEVEGSQE